MSGDLIKQLAQSIHGTVASAKAVPVTHATVDEVVVAAAEAVLVARAKEVEMQTALTAHVAFDSIAPVALLAAPLVALVALQVNDVATRRMQRWTADAKARPARFQERQVALGRGREGSS